MQSLLQVKCPCCNGEGGYTEAILDDGSGPYYPCDFCNDSGTVSIRMRLIWLWDCQIMEWFRYNNSWKRVLCLFGIHSKPWIVYSHCAKINTVAHTCTHCGKLVTTVCKEPK